MFLLEKILPFVEHVALAFLLVYAYGYFCRSLDNERYFNVTMGALFGICAILAMLDPIILAEGIIIDIRNLFVGFAAAYFGFLGGFVALLFGGVGRMSIGGEGMLIGISGMAIAGTMGLLWGYWVRPRIASDLRAFVTLGCMISLGILAGVFLPASVRTIFLVTLAPMLFVVNLFGVVILSHLIKQEQGRLEEHDTLQEAASYDGLTKLMNRQTAVNAYDAMLSKTTASSGIAMLCIDVDHFKAINDTHGHLVGDQVLIGIAQRLSSCLRPDDIFSRISGDEFVVVLNDITAECAYSVANRCQQSVNLTPMDAAGLPINTTVSIGTAWVPNQPSFSQLRFVADQALYVAKEKGRNCLSFEEATIPYQAA